jgi:GTP-binding protein
VEDVVADVPERCAGIVMEKLAARRGRLRSMERQGERVTLIFSAPSRGLFGFRSEFLADTRGEGVLHRTVQGYEPWAGGLEGRGVGALVATEMGTATPYALYNLQDRATLFIEPGTPVDEGQVVGENRRSGDLNVNVCRAKKLSNVRAAGKDEATVVSPPRHPSIESALEWIADDELLEATPGALRLRKRELRASHRKR